MTDATPAIDELNRQVRRFKREAAEAAMALHDVAEECPARWREIPEKAKEAYDRHVTYFDARQQLDALEAAGA